jgi:HPt (histidine-containing phosphotransfer) domain-containing protein
MKIGERARSIAARSDLGPTADSSEASRERPIDLAYLAAQTMEDRDLQAEVLALFSEQASTVRRAIERVSQDERRQLAHGLRGSAGGIGAFAVARCSAEVEHDPAAPEKVAEMMQMIDDALAFIAEIAP